MTSRCVSGVALVVLVAAVASCGRESGAPSPVPEPLPTEPPPAASEEPPAPGLGGRVWVVETVNGEPLPLPADARVPTIEFDETAATANGFAGCNTFSGGYRSTGESIRLGPFATTRRACGALDQVERTFLGALAQSQGYRVTADTLEFFSPEGTPLARFKPRAY